MVCQARATRQLPRQPGPYLYSDGLLQHVHQCLDRLLLVSDFLRNGPEVDAVRMPWLHVALHSVERQAGTRAAGAAAGQRRPRAVSRSGLLEHWLPALLLGSLPLSSQLLALVVPAYSSARLRAERRYAAPGLIYQPRPASSAVARHPGRREERR